MASEAHMSSKMLLIDEPHTKITQTRIIEFQENSGARVKLLVILDRGEEEQCHSRNSAGISASSEDSTSELELLTLFLRVQPVLPVLLS